jgi:DNA-binding transcriptional ArsR family regulator
LPFGVADPDDGNPNDRLILGALRNAGQSSGELAAALGIPARTVRHRLRRLSERRVIDWRGDGRYHLVEAAASSADTGDESPRPDSIGSAGAATPSEAAGGRDLAILAAAVGAGVLSALAALARRR